jgi:GMP synthase-like glutamine amidotransferase
VRIGLLETGEVGAELRHRFGTYPDMFVRLLSRLAPDFSFETVRVVEGTIPRSVHDADGWLISGSRHGTYDDLPWIAPLEAFLRACLAAGVPVVGICFGHQILAQALGGVVEKSGRGWGIGLHDYRLVARPDWLKDVPEHFAIRAMHQDQIVRPPEGAHVLAVSDHCPYAALAYGSRERPAAISVQPHPEFDADYADALIASRAGTVFSEEAAGVARRSLARAGDEQVWGRIIVDFFRTAKDLPGLDLATGAPG